MMENNKTPHNHKLSCSLFFFIFCFLSLIFLFHLFLGAYHNFQVVNVGYTYERITSEEQKKKNSNRKLLSQMNKL